MAALEVAADSGSVGVKEVAAIVGEHRLADIFELTRAVQRRDLPLALRTLERLLAIEEPMRMLVLLTRDLRVAWAVRTLVERGQPPAEIARALRLPPAVVEALGHGDPAALLAEKLRRCWEVERQVKSGGEPRAGLTRVGSDPCAPRVRVGHSPPSRVSGGARSGRSSRPLTPSPPAAATRAPPGAQPP